MPPTPNRSYKVKRTDSALTLPGRTTFPQGSYVPSPALNITPYQLGTGTQASGVSGPQGSSSAMYPAGLPRNQQYPTYSMNVAPKVPTGFGVPAQIQAGFMNNSTTGGPSIYQPLGVPYNQLPRPGFAARPQLPSTAMAQQTQTQVPSTVPVGGAAPFGYNAYGERLDSTGNVWNPATAKTDIYGGRFIQPGEQRWERIGGKLQKVIYGRNGQKKVLRFRDIVGDAEAQRIDQGGRNTSNAGRDVSSVFVSFRA